MYSRFHQNGKRKTDSHNLSWSQQMCELTTPAKMYYIPIYLKCGIYVGYFSFYDFMWDTCGIDIFIVRICMWDKCGIGEKSKSFLGLWDKCGIHI